MRILLTALALSLALPMAACSRDGGAAQNAATIPLTIAMAGKAHAFNVEVARSADEQERGLMFRTSLPADGGMRSEEHTSELQSLMRISYAVFFLKKKNTYTPHIY